MDEEFFNQLGDTVNKKLAVDMDNAQTMASYTIGPFDFINELEGQLRYRQQDELTVNFHQGNTSFLIKFSASPRIFQKSVFDNAMLLSIALCLASLLLFFSYLHKSLTSPIKHITQVVVKALKNKDYSSSVKMSGFDDLSLLCNKINQLFELIQSQHSELISHNVKLQQLSSTDSLTGLDNRRSLDEKIQQLSQNTSDINQPIAILLFDIDCFKLFNDNYGHKAGDNALTQVANLLKSNLHTATDLIARYGGE